MKRTSVKSVRRGRRWRVEMKDERSGRRIINGSRHRKSSRDHHLTRPVAAIGQLVECMRYVRYVILDGEREKELYISRGLMHPSDKKGGRVYGKHGEARAFPTLRPLNNTGSLAATRLALSSAALQFLSPPLRCLEALSHGAEFLF
jgi:hypothetical protein